MKDERFTKQEQVRQLDELIADADARAQEVADKVTDMRHDYQTVGDWPVERREQWARELAQLEGQYNGLRQRADVLKAQKRALLEAA